MNSAIKTDIEARERLTSESKDGHCVLCWERMEYFAIGSCDHPICYKCSSRMRVLANQLYCAACRAEMSQVVFCYSGKKFKEFDLKKLAGKRKYGIRFEDEKVAKEFEKLLEYTCKECGEKEKAFSSFQDLKTHIRKVHDKQHCNICEKNLHVFSAELKVYTKKELVAHRRDGDVNDKAHRGHPECRFCDDRYFDNDALLLHLRKNHFWCHFCEHDGKQDYYNVYDDLRRHFSTAHYLCDEGNCVNEKFTSVFRNKIDYQAHKLASHGKKFNKIQAREARKVDVDFSYHRRPQHSTAIRGADYDEVQREGEAHRMSGRGRGRGRGRSNGSGSRYHRDIQNGTLNYYDYEDVEKERKEFKGHTRRHEAEEVPQSRLNIAAAGSLSSSEPDIHKRLRHLHMDDSDDDVIGLPEHLNTSEEKKTRKEAAKRTKMEEEEENRKAQEAVEIAEEAERQEKAKMKQQAATLVPDIEKLDDDFPSLPGGCNVIFTSPNINKFEEEQFPALGKPHPTQHQVQRNGPSLAGAVRAARTTNPKSVTQINGIPVKTRKKKGAASNHNSVRVKIDDQDDFPSLGATTQSTQPIKADTGKKKPPELKTCVKQMRTVETKEFSPATVRINKTTLPKKIPPGIHNGPLAPPEVIKSKASTNFQPPGLQKEESFEQQKVERNLRLLTMLQTYLDDFNFNNFKTISGQFRRGSKSAEEYYNVIHELLGKNLKFVFSELVALLPDEFKQQELLLAHNNAKVFAKHLENEYSFAPSPDYSKKPTWGAANTNKNEDEPKLSRCDDCGQTFLQEKAMEHMESHQERFPALPTAVKKKKNFFKSAPLHNSCSLPAKSAWRK